MLAGRVPKGACRDPCAYKAVDSRAETPSVRHPGGIADETDSEHIGGIAGSPSPRRRFERVRPESFQLSGYR